MGSDWQVMTSSLFVRDGRFEVDGLALPDLLRLSETPFYVYSVSILRVAYERLSTALPGFEVFFSLKANPNPAICGLLRPLGARAEIGSVGELRTVRDAGYRPGNTIFLGPGKTEREIRAALEFGVYALVAESADELRMIDDIGTRKRLKPGVLLRINTREHLAGAGETMVGGPSKFGFDEEKVVDEVKGLNLRSVRLLGFQDYPASQLLDADVISGHFEYILRLAPVLARQLIDAARTVRRSKAGGAWQLGLTLRCLDFGGGFGVAYEVGQQSLNLAKLSRNVGRLVKKHASELKGCRLIVESGRFLTAESGVFVTRVTRVKESRED